MRRASRIWFVPLVGLLYSCSKGPSTPAGPLGEVDLTSRLPNGVAAPSDAAVHEATLSVCPGGKGDTPASVHVRWKAFAKDGASYVSWYAVDLDKRVPGLVIALDGDPQISNANTRPGGAPLTAVAITLKCTRKESEKLIVEEPSVVIVRGDGKSAVRS